MTATTEGILSASLFIFFLVDPVDIVLTSAWMTFAEAAATINGKTSSHIAKIIEELT